MFVVNNLTCFLDCTVSTSVSTSHPLTVSNNGHLRTVCTGVNSADEVLHCPTCSVATKDPMDCFRNLQPCDPNVKVTLQPQL